MTDADSDHPNARPDAQWTAAWIERQRELLRQQAEQGGDGGTAAEAVRALGEKWRGLGQSYLSGLAEYAKRQGAATDNSADGAAKAPFQVGEELLEVWRAAWASTNLAQDSATRAVSDLLGRLPPVGIAREHTEAWRELASTQAECQRLEQELRAALLGVQRDALDLLDQRVRERAQSDQPVSGYRDLYDLWVECAEQVYAKVAHSEAYSRLQAQLGNASMRLRARQQKVLEYVLRQFDLPTRSELNTVHLRMRQLKEQVVQLEQRIANGTPASERPAAAGKPVKASGASRSSKPGKTAKTVKTAKAAKTVRAGSRQVGQSTRQGRLARASKVGGRKR